MTGEGAPSPSQNHGDRPRARAELMADMAAAWAHEAAQPLAAATNYLFAARHLVDGNAEAVAALDKAAAQMVRAGRMVARLRAFLARRETEPVAQSLHNVIREAIELAAPALRHASVALTLRLEAAEDLVLVNRIEIEQALLSFVGHAAKEIAGSSQRSVTIQTSVGAMAIRTDIVATEARSSGLPHPADASEPTSVPSFGCFSIAQSIIETHRGRVWTSPDSAGRASLSFTLPLLAEPARGKR
jgi:phosphoglycerate-specific signal transduction histidine kinase